MPLLHHIFGAAVVGLLHQINETHYIAFRSIVSLPYAFFYVLILFCPVLERQSLVLAAASTTEFQYLADRGSTRFTRKTEWGVTSVTSSTLEPFTIKNQRYGQACESEAFDFVYREHLCGTPHPERYMDLSRARYTCEGRCGSVPVYEKEFDACACDERCSFYKDCCRDFHTACPQVYTRGQVANAYLIDLADKMKPVCLHGRFTGFGEVYPQERHSTPDQSTTPGYHDNTTIKWMWHRNKKYVSVLSQSIETFLSDFIVGDSWRDIFFENMRTFLSYREPQSKPFFLPQTAMLSCFNIFPDSPSSAAKILRPCYFFTSQNLETPFHRHCKVDRIVSCNCADGQILRQHVHNTCMGQNETASGLSRHKLWSNQLVGRPSKNTQCTSVFLTSTGFTPYGPTHDYKNKKTTWTPNLMKISFAAYVALDSDYQNTNLGDEEKDFEPRRVFNKDKNAEDELPSYVNSKNIYYIVKLSTTLERRLRCPNLKSLLEDCLLEECMHGAVVFSAPTSENQPFGGRLCVVPVRAIVSVMSHVTLPLCLCMRVVAAVSSLHIWTIVLKTDGKDLCSFDLSILRPVADPDVEEYDTLSMVEPRRLSLEEKLQRSFQQTKHACADRLEMEATLQICFYTVADTLGSRGPGRSACLKLYTADVAQTDADSDGYTASATGRGGLSPRLFQQECVPWTNHVTLISWQILRAGFAKLLYRQYWG